MLKQGGQNRSVTPPFERLRRRGLEEHPRLVIAQRWRHPFAVHRPRPLHPQYRVMSHRMAVAQIGIERGEGGEFAADGVISELLRAELLPPSM